MIIGDRGDDLCGQAGGVPAGQPLRPIEQGASLPHPDRQARHPGAAGRRPPLGIDQAQRLQRRLGGRDLGGRGGVSRGRPSPRGVPQQASQSAASVRSAAVICGGACAGIPARSASA